MTGFAALPLEEGSEPYDDESQWAGTSEILGPTWAQLPNLTVGLLGVQVFWSVEMSYASPYLLSLGLTKSLMAIVFIAGPLSGFIVQPLIGVLADNSKSRFGRRRPYMIVGCVVCMIAMLLLGFTRNFAAIFTTWGSSANDVLTVWLAVLAIYCIDFSINAVQAVDRALLVDTLPPVEQANGNAWAARMLGIGSVAGFFIGNVDLPRILPFLGSVQLEVLSVIASFFLLGTHGITAWCTKEKVLIYSPKKQEGAKTGFKGEFKAIWDNLWDLPRVIRQICVIQFFAWIAWFPVLFYTTVYIGELHKRASPVPDTDEAADALDAEATRLGSRALLYSSLLSLTANFLLPFFVSEARTGSVASPLLATKSRFIEKIQVHLASLWASSHAIFALCMAGTFFTNSVGGATFLMTVTGFSWAITQWAPFSLLAEAILSEPATSPEDAGSIHLADTRTHRFSSGDDEQQFLVAEHPSNDGESSRSSSFELEGDDVDGLQEGGGRRSIGVMGNTDAQLSRIDVDITNDHANDRRRRMTGRGLSAKAGVILGIHNLFIVVPQFLVTGLSSIIFAIFDPAKSVLHGHHPGNVGSPIANGTSASISDLANTTHSLWIRQEEARKDGPNSVAIIFRIGGISAAIAFVLCWRLAREIRHR